MLSHRSEASTWYLPDVYATYFAAPCSLHGADGNCLEPMGIKTKTAGEHQAVYFYSGLRSVCQIFFKKNLVLNELT